MGQLGGRIHTSRKPGGSRRVTHQHGSFSESIIKREYGNRKGFPDFRQKIHRRAEQGLPMSVVRERQVIGDQTAFIPNWVRSVVFG